MKTKVVITTIVAILVLTILPSGIIQNAFAAGGGTCVDKFTGPTPEDDSEEVKLCSDMESRFSAAAIGAESARLCYRISTFEPSGPLRLNRKDCSASIPVGSCEFEITKLRETSVSPCKDMGSTFEQIAADAAEANVCYRYTAIVRQSQSKRIEVIECGPLDGSDIGTGGAENTEAAATDSNTTTDPAALVPEFVGKCDFNENGLIDRGEGSEQNGQTEYECAFPTVGGPFVALPLNPDGSCPDGYLKTTIALFEDDSGRPLNCIPKDGGTVDRNPIVLTVRAIIRFMTAGVAIAVAAMIVAGGLIYMASRGNPQLAQKAKVRIFNAVVAFVVYVLAVVIINFLIPGGVL